MTTTTKAEREKHVRQMAANQQIEGFKPDETDKKLQQAYIEGTASLDDLLQYARDFATRTL